jgi:hypothetical protein
MILTVRECPLVFSYFALGGAVRLSFTARIGRAPFYRARSASTKDGLAAPPPFIGCLPGAAATAHTSQSDQHLLE